MPLPSPSLRRFAGRALVDTTGVPEPDHTQLTSAFTTLCHRLRHRLQPLFGAAAVDALLLRSVQVATKEWPWLAGTVVNGQDACSLPAMAALERLEVHTLKEGLATVLAHKIWLLSTFVGEDLVLPLVQQAWGVRGAAGSEDDQ